jgi:hypothetical protein
MPWMHMHPGDVFNMFNMQLAAIVSKLRSLLQAQIETEDRLLLVLVHTRKALECEPGISDFSTLLSLQLDAPSLSLTRLCGKADRAR